MKKLVEWIKKHKVLFVLLVVVVGSVSFVAGIKVADMPAFCGVSCHEMQYYVDSLKASYHGNSKKGEVTCMDCHSEQGFVNHSIEHIKASLLMGMHFTEDYKKDYLNTHKILGRL